jgi:hypothetical protein
MAYDPLLNSVVLFGGFVQWSSNQYFSDTWYLGLNTTPPPPLPSPVTVVVTAVPLTGPAALTVTLYANIAGGAPPFTVDWSLPTANGTMTPSGLQVTQNYSVAGWYPATAFVYNTTTGYGKVLVGFGSVWIHVLPAGNGSVGNGSGKLPKSSIPPSSSTGILAGGGVASWVGGVLLIVALGTGVGAVAGYLFGASRSRKPTVSSPTAQPPTPPVSPKP